MVYINPNPKVHKWHLFITLIISCTNTTVTPGNLNFKSSAEVGVYNVPYKFIQITLMSYEI